MEDLELSDSEDYLDGLLNSINRKKTHIKDSLVEDEKSIQDKIANMSSLDPNDDFMDATGIGDFKPEKMSHHNLREAFVESDFLRDFEEELSSDYADDFIEEFEREIDDEEERFQRGEEIPNDDFITKLMDDDNALDSYDEEKLKKEPGNDASDENLSNENVTDSSTEFETFSIDESFNTADDTSNSDSIEATFVTVDESILNGTSAIEDTLEEQSEDAADELLKALGQDLEDDKTDTNDDKSDTNDDNADTNDTTIDSQEEDSVDKKEKLDEEISNNEDIQNILDGVANIVNDDTTTEESILPKEYQSDEHDDVDALESTEDSIEVNEDGISLVDEDADLDALLSNEEGMSDIGDLLDADENDIELDESRSTYEASADMAENLSDELTNDETPKVGFIQKILNIFKKKNKEDPEAAANELLTVSASGGIEDTTEENNRILEEMDEEEKEAQEKKKKKAEEKAEKKAQKKAEQAEKKAAKKAEKAQKPKKEKKPSALKTFLDDDKAKKIPMKVIVIFILFVATIVVAIIILSNIYNKRTQISEANSQYAAANYIEAYNILSGLDSLSESESQMLSKARMVADLQNKKSEYDVFMQRKDYENALDALIVAVGRYNENLSEAQNLGVNAEYNGVESMIVGQLMDQFGMSDEEAYELYLIKGRTKYTVALNEKLKALGMDNSGSNN